MKKVKATRYPDAQTAMSHPQNTRKYGYLRHSLARLLLKQLQNNSVNSKSVHCHPENSSLIKSTEIPIKMQINENNEIAFGGNVGGALLFQTERFVGGLGDVSRCEILSWLFVLKHEIDFFYTSRLLGWHAAIENRAEQAACPFCSAASPQLPVRHALRNAIGVVSWLRPI